MPGNGRNLRQFCYDESRGSRQAGYSGQTPAKKGMTAVMRLLRLFLRRAIFLIDAILRRCLGIYEFSQAPDCILRLARRSSHRTCSLPDGVTIHVGDPVLEIHLWNEHIPRMAEDGPDLRWGRAVYRAIRRSLEELAHYLQDSHNPAGIMALYGEASILLPMERQSMTDLLRALGFDILVLPRPAGPAGRIKRFLDHAYNRAVIWAFQPASLRDKRLSGASRIEFWMSRQTLLARYGKPATDPAGRTATAP